MPQIDPSSQILTTELPSALLTIKVIIIFEDY